MSGRPNRLQEAFRRLHSALNRPLDRLTLYVHRAFVALGICFTCLMVGSIGSCFLAMSTVGAGKGFPPEDTGSQVIMTIGTDIGLVLGGILAILYPVLKARSSGRR